VHKARNVLELRVELRRVRAQHSLRERGGEESRILCSATLQHPNGVGTKDGDQDGDQDGDHVEITDHKRCTSSSGSSYGYPFKPFTY
jgi:hypothetical protein